MDISYKVNLTASEVQLISRFMKQESFTIQCVDEFFREYGVKMGGIILSELKKNNELCREEVDNLLDFKNLNPINSRALDLAFI